MIKTAQGAYLAGRQAALEKCAGRLDIIKRPYEAIKSLRMHEIPGVNRTGWLGDNVARTYRYRNDIFDIPAEIAAGAYRNYKRLGQAADTYPIVKNPLVLSGLAYGGYKLANDQTSVAGAAALGGALGYLRGSGKDAINKAIERQVSNSSGFQRQLAIANKMSGGSLRTMGRNALGGALLAGGLTAGYNYLTTPGNELFADGSNKYLHEAALASIPVGGYVGSLYNRELRRGMLENENRIFSKAQYNRNQRLEPAIQDLEQIKKTKLKAQQAVDAARNRNLGNKTVQTYLTSLDNIKAREQSALSKIENLRKIENELKDAYYLSHEAHNSNKFRHLLKRNKGTAAGLGLGALLAGGLYFAGKA